MKLGFYDSGIGGLSVLNSFLKTFKASYSYFYFADNANAPYGDKNPEQIIACVQKIFDEMHANEVDLVISACNTSSALLKNMDLDNYFFHVISLVDVLQDYFKNNLEASVLADMQVPVGFLATQSSVNSKAYENWGLNIHAIACPSLVPLVEAGKLDEAKLEWQKYLNQLDAQVQYVIVGCTHYSFLLEGSDPKYKFIDPAKLAVDYFANSLYADQLINYKDSEKKSLDLQMQFSNESPEYLKLVNSLL